PINIQGQVIGINTLKVSSSTVEGMGFAIPSNEAQNIIQQLENQGEIVRPMLGITMIDLSLLTNEQRTNFLNLPEDVQEGIVIVEVSNGTPASEAGLQPNDVITGFNGEEVTSGTQLRQLIYETEVGQEVEIEFYRDGEQQTVTTTMQAGDQNSPNQ
ncbi:peptidase S1, partial [Salmonella enterica subsp. enterica serovar Typhimurium]|uniref:S1C family serine protease n=1 Tax=Salmonella enterica TaxID=28901 RepID=UPI000CCAEA3C